MFNGGLLILLAIVGLILFWLDGSRAREMATALALELCERRGVQFLDGSAALQSLRLRRISEGVRFSRVFSFSYYTEDQQRLLGQITIVGARIVAYRLDGETVING